MTLVSIDLPAMESLIADMQATQDHRLPDVALLRSNLQHVYLDTTAVDPVAPEREIWSWLADRIRDLNRRLSMARLIAGSTPGVPGVGVVQIDESHISELTQTQVQALANEAHGLMTGEWPPESVDPRLLEILRANAHDPYFAQALAKGVPAEKLALYLRGINSSRRGQRSSEEVQAFDSAYDELLTGLGLSYGTASQGTGPLEVPGMAEQWANLVEELPTYSGSAQVLGLVVSRGSFSTSFLTTFQSRLRSLEGDDGVAHWATSGLDMIFDPDPTKSPATNIVGDPLAAVFQGMGNNPEALRQVFGTGPTVTIETDDGAVQVNAYLWDVLHNRGIDEYGVQQLMAGLQTGLTSPPIDGAPAWQPGLAADLDGIMRAIDREARIASEHAPPWYSTAGHLVLDVIGMIPVFGEPADLINGMWYLAEGNELNAGLSFASAIPLVGWFPVGGKWTKRVLTVDELATLQRLSDNGKLTRYLPNGTPVKRFKHWVKLTDPNNFRVQDFLTAAELKRFKYLPFAQARIAGNRFNEYMRPHYPYNEVRLIKPGSKPGKPGSKPGKPGSKPGKMRQVILDSYIPGEAIVSRKLSQLNDVKLTTAIKHINELVNKYPPGAILANVPTNAGRAGMPLRGDMVLEVPPQLGGKIPEEVALHAYRKDVHIIDINGFDYTKHLFDAE